ncbi:hypothetical protein O3G_MSEX003789 [Manduca sexta]|uniref:Uncharacterized protein n=1 Tax=Manduca sexta TaxID=7130 RepID=A0A921YTJ3_MANSE|nr:hypothetical protein O3G_MSEX003789 [Manduca sexta]KAG6445209.1 hypothetical protein O3G_MSEX003789 [Manduca sexta]
MKENKAVSVAKQEQRTERVYEVYYNKIQDERRPYFKDFGCQYDVKRNVKCACQNAGTLKKRDMYFTGYSKQVYAYHGTKSVTDIGVGSIKALQRKRVRRIYLPETDERGIGSEDLSAFVTRKTRPIPRSGYYDQKKTSSKCVGGNIEYNTGCVLNEKLSPIVQTRSGATSPSDWRINTEVASNTIGKDMVTITTQVETEIDNAQENAKNTDNIEISDIKQPVNNAQDPRCSKDQAPVPENSQMKDKKGNLVNRAVSSDSLLQHVHNLENPSDYKQSGTSVDPMENKLEREYRKMFSAKGKDKRPNEKPMSDMKSASVLRRRFEALRRGKVKKEDSKKNANIPNKESNQVGAPIRKDVSIASDPPSLEGRSYSNTKTYSPFHFNNEPEKSNCKPGTSRKRSSTEKKDKDSLQWSQIGNDDSDCQGVKGMFKLWGKTFNLEEDTYKKRSSPISSHQRVNTFTKQPEKKAELKLEKTVKKDGRKFFFFKKKSKEKSKPYKSKKGLTAGRCEVGDGLTIKIDGNEFTPNESKKKIHISEDMLRKQWLHKYLTHAIESKNSVQIRWNNKTYATSSSTIFELMDTVYQDTGIVFRSRSEVTTGESSFYRSKTQHVNFAHQEIEAWMIPNTVVDAPKQKCRKVKNMRSKQTTEMRTSAQKWFIDKAKAFSRKIEVVLHTKHVVHSPKESSSEYLRIDIPKDFFIESSSDENRKPSSDEEVFKIVEYESLADSKRNKKDMATGDHPADDVKLMVQKTSHVLEPNILETVIKGPAARRDVVIQGSDVNIPKRCDVIGVGIITQRDLREIRKPILKIQDYLTDEESETNLKKNQKTCEFAESYLQDYYRHWTPLGMDLFSWCVSDSHLRCNSEESERSYHNQGDGSKSCPNIYDDFQTSAIIPSSNGCDSVCPGQDLPDYEELKPADIEFFKCKWLRKLKVKKSTINNCGKRVLPKDSLEVFKRRKIYASSDKSKWTCSSYCDVKPYSIPSIEDKEAQGLTAEMSRSTMASRGMETRPRPCKKHVSMKEDGTYEYVSKSEGSPAGILMFRGASGCDVCREAAGICPKHATVDPVSCEIPDPPCRPVCLDNPNPPCSPIIPLPSVKKDLQPIKNKCMEPPPPEPEEPAMPPCLTADNLENGPPCQECRSILEGNSPNIDTEDSNSPTDEKPPPPASPATKQPSILCPHFPPCRKSQSCQKSTDYAQNTPNYCPKIPSVAKEALKPPVCPVPPCLVKKKKEGMETRSSSPCDRPPCKKPPSPSNSEQFPWPLKSQKSDQSTLDLPILPPPAPAKKSQSSKSYKCNDDCPLSPKYSRQTIAPKNIQSEGECSGDCANRIDVKPPKKVSPLKCTSPCASPQKPESPVLPLLPVEPSKYKRILPDNQNLKMQRPSKKTCSKQCSAVDDDDIEDGVIQLNSKERITIRMKELTPSTEEIREGMNIKVKDDDGNTLYERREYRKSCKPCRPSLLGDMYKTSDVNRCSTPITIKNVQTSQEREKVEEVENKSDSSVANLVEIQFKLKIMQGDKTTELKIGKNKNDNHMGQIKKSEISPTPQDIFVVKDDDNHLCVKPSPKNDVNIRIVIKNFKSKTDKKRNGKYNDDFTQNISNKFHTVSTGYSDVCTEATLDNVFSVQRATIDLTSSNEKLKTQTNPSENKSKVEFVEEVSKITTPSIDAKFNPSINKVETDHFDEKSLTYKKLKHEDEEDFKTYLPNQEVRASLYSNSEDLDNFEVTSSNADSTTFIQKPRSKAQKKELLKKVMEKAHATKDKSKDKIKQLRDMLKVILTSDSSEHDEMAVTSNELLKDLTFASLQPNFVNETDSMNTSYNIRSILSLVEDSEPKYYPTEEQNSECSKSEGEQERIEKQRGCMCSTFAERLNLRGLGEAKCCCRAKQMKSENTSCDIKTENDILFMNMTNPELVDVEIQQSKNFWNRPPNASNSNCNKTKSNIRNEPTISAHYQEISTRYIRRQNTEIETRKKFVSSYKDSKEMNMKTLNRNIALNISEDDRAILLKATPTNVSATVKKSNNVKGKSTIVRKPHILQSYATKKAVLEIYAEKTIEEDGEHTVAKLPKFVYDKESEIRRYQQRLCHYNSVKRNVVMMSVER